MSTMFCREHSLARRPPRSRVGGPVWRVGPVSEGASGVDRSAASGRSPLYRSRHRIGDRPSESVRTGHPRLGSAAAASRYAVADCDRHVRRRHRTAVPDARACPNFRRVRFAAVEFRRTGDHGHCVGRLSGERRSEAPARRGFDPCGGGRVVVARAGIRWKGEGC